MKCSRRERARDAWTDRPRSVGSAVSVAGQVGYAWKARFHALLFVTRWPTGTGTCRDLATVDLPVPAVAPSHPSILIRARTIFC